MIIFRPQRGRLDEAMKEAKEFENESDMFDFIVKYWSCSPDFISKEDLVIGENIGDDERCGWNSVHYVCSKRFGEENCIELYGCPQAIGYCSYDYKTL